MKKTFLLTVVILFFNLYNAQPGELDSSFRSNGIVTTDFGKQSVYNKIY